MSVNHEVIDRLIAENVMGYKWIPNPYHNSPYHKEYGWHFEIGWKTGFQPSENIQDAWLIVDKVRQYGDFSLIKDVDSSYWIAEFFLSNVELHKATAETAPLAICLAALQSVGVEVEVDG